MLFRSKIEGDITNILNQKIIDAQCDIDSDAETNSWGTSTKTKYTIKTEKGTLVINWLGESNGYYSETVSFDETGIVEGEIK